jgi:hypothetical protein
MPELPTCDCISGFPPYDRLTFIYQAAAELAGDDTLPSADCVAGVPPFQRFAYIYAAFRVIAEDDSLPSQECVEGEPFPDQVTRIYQAVRIYAGDAGLPEVLCVRGTPMWQQWVNIYAALYSAAGEPDELTNPLCVDGAPDGDILSAVFCSLTYLIENANPIVLSAVIQEDGTSVLITFNQAVAGSLGFSFTINGDAPHGTSYQSGDGTTQLVLGIEDSNIVQGDVVLMSYTPGNVVSVATGNPLESFTDFPVTNPFNVFFYLRPDGVSRYLRPDGVSFYLRP